MHSALCHAERGEATCMLGGSGACSLKKIFKMVQFDAFWSVFCYNFVKKNIVKIFIFIKIKDTVLLRIIFRGTLEHIYSPECLFIV